MKILKKIFLVFLIFVFILSVLLITPSPYDLAKRFKVEPAFSAIQQVEMSDVVINKDISMFGYLSNKYINGVDYEEGYYYY